MLATLPPRVSLLALAIGLAVGGAIALFGAFGGPWIKARTDADQWRRDKRLDAYTELSRTMTEFLVTAESFKWGAAPSPAVVDAARQTLHEVIRAEARVRLMAPETVRRETTQLGWILHRLVMHFGPELPEAGWVEARWFIEGAQESYGSFMDAARRDLGVQ